MTNHDCEAYWVNTTAGAHLKHIPSRVTANMPTTMLNTERNWIKSLCIIVIRNKNKTPLTSRAQYSPESLQTYHHDMVT